MKAILKNYRQSPRKVRLVTDLIKGKSVASASRKLDFVNKRASRAVKKLIDSASANAKENNSVKKEDLYVKNIIVDEGRIMYRIRARARGSASRIRKRTSNIVLTLGKKK
jgi:large subunit ribosomal protein L22